MANKGRLSFEKRQREIKKKEKRQEKLERRTLRKQARLNGDTVDQDTSTATDATETGHLLQKRKKTPLRNPPRKSDSSPE